MRNPRWLWSYLLKYTTTGCFCFRHFLRILMDHGLVQKTLLHCKNYRQKVNKTHKAWMKFSNRWNAKPGPPSPPPHPPHPQPTPTPTCLVCHSCLSRFAAACLQEPLLPSLLYSLGILPLGADTSLHPPSQPSLLVHLHSFLSATCTQKHFYQGPSVATLGWDTGR